MVSSFFFFQCIYLLIYHCHVSLNEYHSPYTELFGYISGTSTTAKTKTTTTNNMISFLIMPLSYSLHMQRSEIFNIILCSHSRKIMRPKHRPLMFPPSRSAKHAHDARGHTHNSGESNAVQKNDEQEPEGGGSRERDTKNVVAFCELTSVLFCYKFFEFDQEYNACILLSPSAPFFGICLVVIFAVPFSVFSPLSLHRWVCNTCTVCSSSHSVFYPAKHILCIFRRCCCCCVCV